MGPEQTEAKKLQEQQERDDITDLLVANLNTPLTEEDGIILRRIMDGDLTPIEEMVREVEGKDKL